MRRRLAYGSAVIALCAVGGTASASHATGKKGQSKPLLKVFVVGHGKVTSKPSNAAGGVFGHREALKRRSPSCPSSSAPKAIVAQGYHVKFVDCFKGKLNRAKWRRSMYWERQASSRDVYSRNGIAHIITRRSEGYPNHSLSSLSTSGGQPRHVWRQGYFEARFKYTSATGAMPAFWLMSASDALNPNAPGAPPPSLCPALHLTFCPSAEIDMFEHFPVNGLGDHEATLHRNTSGRWGLPDSTRPVFSHLRYNLGASWHTYGTKWTKRSISYYLDGRLLGSVATFGTTDQPMFLTLYMWTDVYGPGPDARTPDALDMQVDWVRVWQQ